MNEKKQLHPGWVVLSLLLFPPLGLILFGERCEVRLFYKVCIALCYGVFLVLFIQYYQIIPRTPTKQHLQHTSEQIQYAMSKVEYPVILQNGIKEMVRKEEDEKWVQVFFEVTNAGENKMYYISLLDSPVLITKNGRADPDLSLSFEPFGEISPHETKTGYLVFRIAADEVPVTFQIGAYTANLQ
jgi:hypothetical protein